MGILDPWIMLLGRCSGNRGTGEQGINVLARDLLSRDIHLRNRIAIGANDKEFKP